MSKTQILIVEDDAIIAMDLESRMKKLGYGVTGVAGYGEQAIEKVKENTPDVVLMDIILKGEIDGIETAEIIRNQFDIPVIFITGYADKERLKRAKLTYPFGFIVKPFQDKDLEITIEMALYVAKADAERRKAEKRQELLIKLLELLNQSKERIDEIRDILFLIKETIGFEAVAIRLQEGEDFPYYHANGFPAEFVEAERNLCARDQHGEIIRDSQGKPYLDCMCGNVICARTDSSLPFFTAEGSFWSNSTTELLATTTEADRQARMRNRCNGEGYESVALIPLRSDDKIIGLLQLNDRRKNMFTLEMIHFFEGMGDSIGIALDRQWTRAALEERMKELNCLYSISALLELPGISLGEIFERTIMFIPPAWQFPDITAARIVWGGQSFQTGNFRETPWMQSSKIIVYGKPGGQVDVCFLEEQPASNEGPFLTEEQPLLNTIAERLGKIIERISARDALRESEEKYRSLVESTNDWVWACDLEGRQTFANEAVKTILGYDVHEIEGVLYENLIHPEDQKKTRQWFKSSIEKKKGWKNAVIRCRHKDGTLKFLESTAQPSFDAKGNLTGFIGIDRDITERKRADDNLKENLSFLQTLIDTIPNPLFYKDVKGEYLDVNRAYEEFYGKPRQEIIGKTVYDMGPKHIADKYYEKDQELFQRPQKQTYERKVINAAGETRDVIFNKASYADQEGKVKGLIGIISDITERKRAEEALRESEEKYRSIMEAMDDEVYICSPDFRIEFMNPAIKKRIGYDATGEPCHKVMHGLDEKCPWCVHGKVMKGETVKTEFVSPKDGKTFHVSNSPIFHTDGSISKLTVFRDVTETKKMIEQLQQSQKILSIGTLAGGIAHDFNNILFPIMGFGEMALDDAPENSPLRNKIEEILQGIKRARDLVKQILAFSRQSGQELKPLKVQLIVKEVLKLIKSSIPTTIEIKQHITNQCGLVIADPTQIHQVAMNLMTNAYHAMEDEGGKLEVTLQEVELGVNDFIDPSMNPGPYVCLSVADTGTGMDQITLERIFEPYFTTKKTGKGTGLGLSVVHGIVKSYQGDIKVYSEPGKGAVFHIYLPVIKSRFETEKTEAIEPVPKGTEMILLVDDEESIVRMETEMLERLGYDVTERTSSIEALEAFRDSPGKFDLVITDMTMPNMTGVQLSQKLLEIRPDIPIIICTGFSAKIDNAKAKEFGIRGFVMKPVVMSELAKKIREVLDQEEG